MTREQARERVLDYAYGELPADEAAAFEALLRDDPELAAALEDVRAVRRAAAELPAPELPGAVRRRILDAAGAASRRRAWAARLEHLRAMFLSPAFLGAAGVVAAVVVGLHVLDPGGGDGPTSSGDRGVPVLDEVPMVATSARPSPVAEEVPASAPAPVAAADEAEAAGAQRPVPERSPAASTAAGARAKSTTVAREARPTRKQEAGAVPTPDAAPGLGGLVGSGLGGGGAAATGAVGVTGAAPQGYGRAGLAKRAAGAAPAATSATAPVDDVATRVEAAEAEAPAPRRTAATLADGDGAFATPPPAAAKARAAQVPAEDADRVTAAAESAESVGAVASDPAGLLAEARAARARGRAGDALSLCRQALALAPAGGLLLDLLAEAAELALFLSRDDEARGYLDRLERLPGGAERARAIRDR